MKHKLTAGMFGMIMLFAAVCWAPGSNDASPGDAMTLTTADAGYVLFEKVYPRMTGERELYIVMKDEDKAMSAAIAKAANEMSEMRLARGKAVAVSGNLVYVPVPFALQRSAGNFAQKLSALEFKPPARPVKGAPTSTRALITLLSQVDDRNVRMSAMTELARRDSVDAFKALENTYKNSEGWTKRCASYAMYLYGKENAESLAEYRKKFASAYHTVTNLLAKQPRTQEQLKKQIEDLRAAFEKMIAYTPPEVPGLDATDEKMRKGLIVLYELIGKVQMCYSDKESIDTEKLFDAAMKGISEHLDRYSEVFDRESKERWDRHIKSSFVGIGVTIERNDEGNFIVVSPIFGSPAYRAGFKPRDVIATVDGKPVKGLEMDELRMRITGKEDTVVRIGIIRKGWQQPKEFPIVRAVITLPVALFKMMPGSVGYLRLLQFSIDSHKEFAKALAELNRQNMKGLIIDLRNNPGGSLQQTLAISDMFIKTGKTLASMKGRTGTPWQGQVWRASFRTRKQPNYPIAILVNGASASGSELLTGTMKDNGRAIVIGQKTFGKGRGQTIFTLYSSDGERFLKLTVFKYYLPNGECVDGTGIEPNIPLEVEEVPEWKTEELNKLTIEVLDEYAEEHFKKNEELFKRLADGDDFNVKKYPGFDKFYRSLKTKLDRQDVRRVLRNHIRRVISREAGKPYINNIQEDTELQRAIYEVLKEMGVNPASVNDFRDYAKRIEKEIAKEKKSDKSEN